MNITEEQKQEATIKEIDNKIVAIVNNITYDFITNADRLKSVTFSEQFDKLKGEDLINEIKKGMVVNTVKIFNNKAYYNG